MKQATRKNVGLLIMLIAISTSSLIYAQPPGGRQGGQQGPPPVPNEKQIEKMVNDLSEELSLTEEQEEKVLDEYLIHFEQVEEKTKDGKPNRNEMEALKSEFEENVKLLLSDEQDELFDAYQKANAQQKGGQQRQGR